MADEMSRNTDIVKIRIDSEAKVDRMIEFPEGKLMKSMRFYWAGPAIRTPEASVSREDFPAGSTIRIFLDYTEVHYILGGKAEITYRIAPLYLEEKTITAETGDAYVIPKGTILEFKVDPSGPYKKLCVIMPGFRVDKYIEALPKELAEKAFKTGIDNYI